MDDRERFDKIACHAVHNRDGQLYLRTPSWLHGGSTACMCGGDPDTPLVERGYQRAVGPRGCEMISDQVVGANWPAQLTGTGTLKDAALDDRSLHRATDRHARRHAQIEPDAVVCIEEPNEWFNHLMGCRTTATVNAGEWASVFITSITNICRRSDNRAAHPCGTRTVWPTARCPTWCRPAKTSKR